MAWIIVVMFIFMFLYIISLRNKTDEYIKPKTEKEKILENYPKKDDIDYSVKKIDDCISRELLKIFNANVLDEQKINSCKNLKKEILKKETVTVLKMEYDKEFKKAVELEIEKRKLTIKEGKIMYSGGRSFWHVDNPSIEIQFLENRCEIAIKNILEIAKKLFIIENF